MAVSSASNGSPGSTAASLVAGVQSLDPAAWQRLASLYGPLIYGWARRSGLSGEDAADITQEVFRAVVTAAPQLQHGRPGDTFRGWLWTITRNKLRDFWRGRADRPIAAGGTDAHALLQLVAENLTGEQSGEADAPGLLRRAVQIVRSEFETRSWDAFWRVTVEGRAAGDVAGELGMSLNAVYVARSRILRRLRDLLTEGPVSSNAGAQSF
jgi:RNA polymerase sigma-70 factor (ECF subfamily)